MSWHAERKRWNRVLAVAEERLDEARATVRRLVDEGAYDVALNDARQQLLVAAMNDARQRLLVAERDVNRARAAQRRAVA
jgi:hypothetical protein